MAIRTPFVPFSTTNRGFGERIATPVCGLVRNDSVFSYLFSIATATSRATFIIWVKEF